LIKRVTNLAKYPERTGLSGLSSVLKNLKSLSKRIYLLTVSFLGMVLSSSSGSINVEAFSVDSYDSVTVFSAPLIVSMAASAYFSSSAL
jgi:hypothetical protein